MSKVGSFLITSGALVATSPYLISSSRSSSGVYVIAGPRNPPHAAPSPKPSPRPSTSVSAACQTHEESPSEHAGHDEEGPSPAEHGGHGKQGEESPSAPTVAVTEVVELASTAEFLELAVAMQAAMHESSSGTSSSGASPSGASSSGASPSGTSASVSMVASGVEPELSNGAPGAGLLPAGLPTGLPTGASVAGEYPGGALDDGG